MFQKSNVATVFAISLGLAGCAQQPGAGGYTEPEGVGAVREAATPAAAQNVKVVNAAADWAAPVPTVAQGTTNVAGTLGATQSGTWNVGISGSPTVSAQQSGSWSTTIEGDVSLAAGTSVSALQGGPWSVSLAGTPSVALAPGTTVALSGTPSVSLAGTPSVNIANMPSVNVANFPATQPVSGTVNVGNFPAPAPIQVAFEGPVDSLIQVPTANCKQVRVSFTGGNYTANIFSQTSTGNLFGLDKIDVSGSEIFNNTRTYDMPGPQLFILFSPALDFPTPTLVMCRTT